MQYRVQSARFKLLLWIIKQCRSSNRKNLKVMEKEKKKHTPKYAMIEWTNLDYRRLPPIPESFCDRQAKTVPVKIKEKKEEWKRYVAIYEMLEQS